MNAQDMENKLLADVREAKKALLDEVDSAKKEELRMMWKEAKDELNSFRRQQVAGGPGTSVTPAISDSIVMDAMFAPFEEPALFHTMDAQALHGLLSQPLAARCPVPASQWPHYRLLAEGLFELESSTTAPRLLSVLGSALHAPWPTGMPSELLYTPFWATVGLGLPEFASSILGFDVSINRNVEDPSITLPNKKRDYMVMVGNILLVGGEDKARVGDLQAAQTELLAKHRGSNASQYGRLDHILLVATAGPLLAVHALRLQPGVAATSEPVVDSFNMVVPSGRLKVMQIMINITRWLRTIHKLKLLPPPPPAPLFQEFRRPSPYTEWEGLEDEEVTLKLCCRHVEKKFLMPQQHVQTLCNVYHVLAFSAIPHAVRCIKLKVNNRVVDLQMQPLALPALQQLSRIELHLFPVGARFHISTSDQLRSLTTSLLTTAAAMHRAGIVHCDIRAANVVQYCSDWVLIDWELAGPINTPVWWRAKETPPAAQLQGRWPIAADLWQIGRLIQGYTPLDPPCQSVAQDLMNGTFSSAEAALAALAGA